MENKNITAGRQRSRQPSLRGQSGLPGRGRAVLESRAHAGGHVFKYGVVEWRSPTRARHAHHKATDAHPEGHGQTSKQPEQRPLEETHHNVCCLAHSATVVKRNLNGTHRGVCTREKHPETEEAQERSANHPEDAESCLQTDDTQAEKPSPFKQFSALAKLANRRFSCVAHIRSKESDMNSAGMIKAGHS